jgi:hypothetical protein
MRPEFEGKGGVMKKYNIAIGVIILIIVSIFEYDARIEKKARREIAERRAKEVPTINILPNISPGYWKISGSVGTWSKLEEPTDTLSSTYIEFSHDGTAPKIYGVTPSQAVRIDKGEDINKIILDDRLSAIEQRLEKIEKMLTQSRETKKGESKLRDIPTEKEVLTGPIKFEVGDIMYSFGEFDLSGHILTFEDQLEKDISKIESLLGIKYRTWLEVSPGTISLEGRQREIRDRLYGIEKMLREKR